MWCLLYFFVPSSSYIPWNLHEQEKGKFYFSEILDLEYVVILLLWDNPSKFFAGEEYAWLLRGALIVS